MNKSSPYLPPRDLLMVYRGINQKLMRALLWVLGVVSLVIVLLFWGAYQVQLREERSQASSTVNQLLQVSLENAMLKRDLPGLKEIVNRLSEQTEILDVVILDRHGEIRFSGAEQSIGQPFDPPLAELCKGCEGTFNSAVETTHFYTRPDGHRVLRSVNPVKNKPGCTKCHGRIKDNAVNGVLLVDYDAEPIFRKARVSVMWLGLAGIIALLAAGVVAWRFINQQVLKPVSHLREMSDQIAQGNLQARAEISSQDEFEVLGNSFNQMAERLDKSLHQLLENADYLQALVDAIPDGIRVIDARYEVVLSNQAYKDQLGIEGDSGDQLPCYFSSHQKNRPCPPTLTRCPLYEIEKNPVPIKTMQQFKRADGTEFDVQVFAAPLETGHNASGQIVESIRNLSEDIRFSQEQKLSALGQLATGVAHEIHNPLSSIRMALKGALSMLEAKEGENDEISRYLRLVDGEIDKCIDVTKRLLKLSGFGGEKMQLVDINIAIEETLSLLKYEAKQKNIKIELDLPRTPVRMSASGQDIRMLILNLAQNAFHSMPKGGLLYISAQQQADDTYLYFCDTGVGVKPEHKARIFDPFFSYRADKNQGTGLGLTICQSIVQRYHGSISVKDKLPHGSCFTVYLMCPECVDENMGVAK